MTQEKEKSLVNLLYVWVGFIMVILFEVLSGFMKNSLTSLFNETAWLVFAGMFLVIFYILSFYAYRVLGHGIISLFTKHFFYVVLSAYTIIFLGGIVSLTFGLFFTM